MTQNKETYQNDANGNTLSMPHLASMLWDYKDELKEVTLNASGDKAYYVYDSSGERVRKVIEKGNIKEERYYLGDYEVYRKTTNGTLDIERETLFIKDDTKSIAQIDNDGTTEIIRYQYDNHLGSASLELDENAEIISYEEYHPFGTTSYRSGRTETEVSLKRYKYVGKERDEETGLYYYGARYYSAWICRFVSVDPLQFDYPYYTPYQYTGNNPITFTDLDGAETTENQTTNVKPNGQQAPGFMMYETAKHGGMIPGDAKAGKMAYNKVGNYKITPYYRKAENGGWNLSHYTAGRDVPIGQYGDSYFREEWIIRPNALNEFKTKEARWWYPLQRPSGIANVVYAGGFEDFEKEFQLKNYGKAILGYGKAQWTNPEKLVAGATVGIAGFEAMATKTLYRGVNESHPGYSNALEGKISSRGGNASPSQHNAGNTNSSYTSWTTNIEVAKNYALRPDGMGAILKLRTNKALSSPSLKSIQLKQAPNIIINEAEMLMKGNVRGAKVYKTK